jgi:hypothetical protein
MRTYGLPATCGNPGCLYPSYVGTCPAQASECTDFGATLTSYTVTCGYISGAMCLYAPVITPCPNGCDPVNLVCNP